MKRWALILTALVLVALPLPAMADLIFVGEVALSGQGFGSNGINIVTGHDTGSTPHPLIESACIDAGTGSLGRQGVSCAGGITGGDEPAPDPPSVKHNTPTLTALGVSLASEVGLIFNLAEPGSNELKLADGNLYVQFFNGVGYFEAFYNGPELTLTEQGTGKAGFGFALDDAQAALADAHCAAGNAECTVGAGFEVTEFQGGNETLTAIDIDRPLVINPLQPVPEPATLFLLGSGLAGAGIFGRKRLARKQS